MKHIILVVSSLVMVAALLTGCGAKPSSVSSVDSDKPLSASELSMLMDFHAWKIPIPASQQPFKSIQLAIEKPDGTVVTNIFGTGHNLGSSPCSVILIGFRIEQGTLTGRFSIVDADGGGVTWGLDFKGAFADAWTAWSGENPIWNNNHVQIAMATKDGELKDSRLVIELVK